MRTINRTARFKKDYKRELKHHHGLAVEAELPQILIKLAADYPLDARFRDHPLTGAWKDHRDCHVRPDLVLIYRKPDDEHLDLVRLGSHNELGL